MLADKPFDTDLWFNLFHDSVTSNIMTMIFLMLWPWAWSNWSQKRKKKKKKKMEDRDIKHTLYNHFHTNPSAVTDNFIKVKDKIKITIKKLR